MTDVFGSMTCVVFVKNFTVYKLAVNSHSNNLNYDLNLAQPRRYKRTTQLLDVQRSYFILIRADVGWYHYNLFY